MATTALRALLRNHSVSRGALAPARSFCAQPQSTTHFGFTDVEETAKAGMVYEVFERVAEKYDVMNDVMSGTMHRYWKDEFVKMLGPLAVHKFPIRVLDVAGGTGDIAFRIFDQMKNPYVPLPTRDVGPAGEIPLTVDSVPTEGPGVIVSDINPHMLRVGQKRAVDLGIAGSEKPFISWLEANAETLPLPAESVDVYTIAFGIRNVTHIDAALSEAFRVLKPGGRFFCLEFSQVEDETLRWVYDNYSFHVIPAMGELVAGDRDSYQYLVESIRKFPPQPQFAALIEQAGFSAVTYTNFTNGVVAAHSGFKL